MKPTAVGAVVVMVLWASCYPLISLSLAYAPIMLTAFLRAAVSGLALVVLALLLKRPMPKSVRDWCLIAMIGFTATSIGFWGMFYAGSLVSPGYATVLTNTQPILASVLGWYFLHERPGKLSLGGILLGFFGILVISANSLVDQNSQAIRGIVYILIAATGIAVSNILLKKLSNRSDLIFSMGFQLLIGSIPLGFMGISTWPGEFFDWNWNYIWILITLAIPGTAVPFVLWFWLMSKAPLYKLNVYSFLTPVFGLYIGYVYFSESLTLYQWLGVAIVITAITLVTVESRKGDNPLTS